MANASLAPAASQPLPARSSSSAGRLRVLLQAGRNAAEDPEAEAAGVLHGPLLALGKLKAGIVLDEVRPGIGDEGAESRA